MLIVQALRRNASYRARDAAMLGPSAECDWLTFVDRVARLAGGLRSRRVKPEDRVGIWPLTAALFSKPSSQCGGWAAASSQ